MTKEIVKNLLKEETCDFCWVYLSIQYEMISFAKSTIKGFDCKLQVQPTGDLLLPDDLTCSHFQSCLE